MCITYPVVSMNVGNGSNSVSTIKPFSDAEKDDSSGSNTLTIILGVIAGVAIIALVLIVIIIVAAFCLRYIAMYIFAIILVANMNMHNYVHISHLLGCIGIKQVIGQKRWVEKFHTFCRLISS